MAKRILCIEDSEAYRQLVKLTLKNKGYELEFACEGLEGLKKLEASGFDLVILDLWLPNLNGFDVLAELNASSLNCAVPVLVLTGDANEETKQKLLKMGVKTILSKPFKTHGLIQAVAGAIQMPSSEKVDGKRCVKTSRNPESDFV